MAMVVILLEYKEHRDYQDKHEVVHIRLHDF